MARSPDLEDVLVLAPFRQDANMLSTLLEGHEIRSRVCRDGAALEAELGRSMPGALVVTQEALTAGVVALVRDHVKAQPEWSELAVVVIVEKDAVRSGLPRYLAEQWEGARQVFYQRPLTAIEILSGIQSALLARLRQRDVRDHLDLERELRHELNHRVKNILASVNSIFQMTTRSSQSLDELKSDFGGRLTTLGSVHAALFDAGGEMLALEALVRLVLSPYLSDLPGSFVVEGPDLPLDKDATAAMGLVIHELVTNAIKYGAWSGPGGLIRVSWRIDEGRFVFRWEEEGGPEPKPAATSGYGTRYVRMALQGQLGAAPTFAFPATGLVLAAEGEVDRIRAKGG